ncbi:MurR/RpiR family transcriptional regulator [Bacillus sp. JJ1122]|uniref:MurR/RpiR family transcriptional regulator n=1 Tax=Bacillus sp. JJ1122 TaxID=3122951 RepID=UPI0030004C81
MGYIIEHFSHAIPSLTHAEKHVLYYIESNLEKAKQLSLTAMAEENNVSTTTIVRMCHKLGLEGFTELKFFLKGIENEQLPGEKNPLDRYRNDISNTLASIQLEEIEKIANVITHSSRVIIVAVGLSKMMGEYFSKLFMQVNKTTIYVYESHIIDILTNMLELKDMVIFISSSGETKTLTKIAEKVKYKTTQTLAITNAPDSTLANLTEYTISASVQRITFAGYDLTARSTLVMLIDLLFEVYLKNK